MLSCTAETVEEMLVWELKRDDYLEHLQVTGRLLEGHSDDNVAGLVCKTIYPNKKVAE
jgi:hypothetical protein